MAELQDDPLAHGQERPFLRDLAGQLLGQVTRPMMMKLLSYPKMREYVLHQLSNELAMQKASFRADVPPHLHAINGFEDCYWLWSSNKLNHGIIRMRLDQGAFIYRLIRSLGNPRVIELGRYRGGGAFLLAAAGAHVVSLDNGELPGQEEFTAAFEEALNHFGLRDRVEILMADALTYPVEPESWDYVGLDFPKTYDLAKQGFEYWWPGVKRGGYMLINNGKNSILTEVVEYISSVDIEALGGTKLPDTPGSFVVFRKNA